MGQHLRLPYSAGSSQSPCIWILAIVLASHPEDEATDFGVTGMLLALITKLDFLSGAFLLVLIDVIVRNLLMVHNFFPFITVRKVRWTCHVWFIFEHWRARGCLHHACNEYMLGRNVRFDGEGGSMIENDLSDRST